MKLINFIKRRKLYRKFKKGKPVNCNMFIEEYLEREYQFHKHIHDLLIELSEKGKKL